MPPPQLGGARGDRSCRARGDRIRIFKICCELDDAENEVVLLLLVGEPAQGLHDIACVVRTGEICVPYAKLVGKLNICWVFDGNILRFLGNRTSLNGHQCEDDVCDI